MRSVIKIRSFFLILGLCWIFIDGNSQDTILSKKEKKEARKAEKLKDYSALGILLESRKFSFGTDRAQANTGTTVMVILTMQAAMIIMELIILKANMLQENGDWR